MSKQITIKVIDESDPYEIVLENHRGDTFTFNPHSANGEELYDFLMF